MSRELKFKAWDRAKKAFIDNWQDSQWIEYAGFDGGDSFDVMQFTGLIDKNGVEIYEGDIVAHPEYIISPGAVIQWDENTWSIGAAWPVSEFYEGELGEIEVIGNIHANPELLTQ